jgi:bifunctional DNA-binding transcriptional regulator/antitoxin component of YhaV-PrlF toxin-antitoxin module
MARPKRSSAATARINVSPTGRLSLPVDMRRAIGLEKGGTVVVDVDDGAIRLRTLDDVIAAAQESARRFAGKGASTDDFLRARRGLWRK